MRRGAPRACVAAALVALALGAGCGAKTGLDVPDASRDAGVPEPDASRPPLCIEVPPDAGPVTAEIRLPVSLAVVDVMFVIDATASMIDEIDNVREGLQSRVVPGVRDAIPDAAFGLAYVGEFPVEPHGPRGIDPYQLRARITRDVVQIEAALAVTPSWGNFDDPEAQVEALYQVSTGEGLAPFIEPSFGCPGGGEGGACFRSEALPVIVLITDAPFHNGPMGEDPYDFESHDYDEAVAALEALDALVVGLGASDPGAPGPIAHLRAIAEDTGAVDAAGQPLAFDIGRAGDRVDRGIVSAIQRLAEGVPLDVDALAEDVPGDAIDARTLVRAIRPAAADPPDGVLAIGPDRFVGVRPGTRVVFEIDVDASVLEPSAETRRIPLRITFRAFGRSLLGREEVLIVVPGTDGGGCDRVPARSASTG